MKKTPTQHRYIRGEMLILRNSLGGRLFIVHEHTDEGVIEKYQVESQQKYAQPTRLNQLVKVGSAHETERVLETLRETYERASQQIRHIETQRDRELNQILGLYDRKE